MNTFSLAIKNLKNTFSFYLLFLISVSLVIMIFYAFTSFSMNSVMLEKISADGRVETMCNTISIFLMIFVVFYMTYSNRFFLRRRTKEVGIYMLLGYRKSAILSLLIVENIFTNGIAFFVGVLFGAALHKGIVMGITVLLHLSLDSTQIPLFSMEAAAKTAGFILLVVFVLALSNGRFLNKISLMDLVRYEKKAEKNMEFRFLPALFGFILMVLGYGLALDISRGLDSIWFTIGFSPVGMLTMMFIVIGTVFFIASFLPYIIQKSKNNKRGFYTETNIITTPNFIYRIRSNARTLIMLTLLSAAALTISSVMALTIYYPIAAVSRMAPSEIEFRITSDDQVKNVKQLIKNSSSDIDGISFIRTDIYKVVSSADQLPVEYSLGTAKGDVDNESILREAGFECIAYTDYIHLLQAQGKEDTIASMPQLDENECIYVKYQPDSAGKSEVGNTYPLAIGNAEIPITVKKVTLENPISFANSIGTMIISDMVYEQIKSSAIPAFSILSINGEAVEDNEKLYEGINNILDNSPYLQGHSHKVNELFEQNSSTFLLIGFLVILFFIATGSILYFNNVVAVSDTKADYEILMKMGYTNKGMKKIIRKQIMTFFSIPFILGLLDCFFATLVYKTGLMQNLLGNSLIQYIPVALAVALTAMIYLIYYWLTVHTCYKTIFNS